MHVCSMYICIMHVRICARVCFKGLAIAHAVSCQIFGGPGSVPGQTMWD